VPDHPVPRLHPALLVPVLVLVAGCGGGTDTASAPGPSPAAAAPTSSATAPTGDATEVDVTATEYVFELSQETFTPGTYTFVVDDAGGAPHALSISGPGIDETSDRVDPGGSTELTVDLQAGDYELLCPVGNHADQGMRMTITVG